MRFAGRIRPDVVLAMIGQPCWKRKIRGAGLSYKTDYRSRTRAIAVYGAILCVGAGLGFLVRAGVITDHLLW